MSNTRNLTVDESETLLRKLVIALGTYPAAHAALRVISENGCGVFRTDDGATVVSVENHHHTNEYNSYAYD